MHQATVFFATCLVPYRLILRLILIKQYKRAYWAILARLTRLSTWSDLGHVGIGAGTWVLDPALSGFKLFPLSTYLHIYPTLSHAYVVPTPRLADHTHIHLRPRLRVWPTLLKWWSGGRWDTDDCVCVARRVLADAGVEVPRSCWSPKKLDKWLKDKGFERVELRKSVPC